MRLILGVYIGNMSPVDTDLRFQLARRLGQRRGAQRQRAGGGVKAAAQLAQQIGAVDLGEALAGGGQRQRDGGVLRQLLNNGDGAVVPAAQGVEQVSDGGGHRGVPFVARVRGIGRALFQTGPVLLPVCRLCRPDQPVCAI